MAFSIFYYLYLNHYHRFGVNGNETRLLACFMTAQDRDPESKVGLSILE